MAAKTIEFQGMQEVIESLRAADDIFTQEGKKYLRDWGIYGVKQFQMYTLNAGAYDLGELLENTHYELKSNSKSVTAKILPSKKADRYAIYVEEGTRPHWVPAKALQGWADRHGIPVWAVQQKIAREGTEPRWMWRDTFADVEEKVDNEASDLIDSMLRRI